MILPKAEVAHGLADHYVSLNSQDHQGPQGDFTCKAVGSYQSSGPALRPERANMSREHRAACLRCSGFGQARKREEDEEFMCQR